MGTEQSAGGRAAQQEIDFTDAARLEAHLVRCGLSDVQARLCGLVFRRGEAFAVDGQVFRKLRISSRNAAGELRSTSPAVIKAARRVEKMGLMRVMEAGGVAAGGGGRPPTYVLDVVACRALATLDELLEDELEAAGGASLSPGDWSTGGQVLTGANRCKPVQTTAPVPVEESLRDSCHPVPVPEGGPGGAAASGSQRLAAVRGGSQSPADPRAVPRRRLPWSAAAGFTNEELEAAVRRRDVAWLEHLFDEAASMGWIAARRRADDGAGHECDAWLRFLTLSSCAARRAYHSKRRAMIAAVKRNVDVSRTSHADEDWAQAIVRDGWRDPALAVRMMSEVE